MEKLDKVIRAGEAKVELKKFCSWFDGPVQTPQDKLAKAVIKQCIEIIDKLKPGEAEPIRHAHWEDEYGGKYANPRYRCSTCKAKALYELERNELGHWFEVQALTTRCHCCGAHMDEEVADGTDPV